MGHSLSVLTRNTFHEFGIFHGASSDKAAVELRHASTTAAARYLAEMSIIEGFLMEHGICANDNDLKDEREMIHYLAKPAVNSDAVQIKAATILDELVPRYINIRLERLYALVKKLREVDDEIPPLMQRSDVALRQAYEVFRGADADTKRRDAAQDALMIMATKNWKPKKVPEHLPLLHYQTVARIRNKVLKRLNDAELFIFKHRQSDRDLEVFLVVTALLYEAQTNEQI